MPRHGQELALGVRPLDVVVPVSTEIASLLLVAARRRHCGRPPARAVVLVDSPLVKTGTVRPDSGDGHMIVSERRHAVIAPRNAGGSSVWGDWSATHDASNPYSSFIIRLTSSRVLLWSLYRPRIVVRYLSHSLVIFPCLFKNHGLHAGVAWSPVLDSCGPAWGRPGRAARVISYGWELGFFSSCLGQYVFWI